MRLRYTYERVATALTAFTRKYIVDECPDEKMERLRQKRVDDLLLDVVAIEAVRRWQVEGNKISAD